MYMCIPFFFKGLLHLWALAQASRVFERLLWCCGSPRAFLDVGCWWRWKATVISEMVDNSDYLILYLATHHVTVISEIVDNSNYLILYQATLHKSTFIGYLLQDIHLFKKLSLFLYIQRKCSGVYSNCKHKWMFR